MIVLPAGAELPNNPRIGWQSLIQGATATSSAAGFPAVNLTNDVTALYWRAVDATAQTLTFDLGAAVAIDYLGIARHNLGTCGATYTLQRSVDGTTGWTTVAGPILPLDNGIVMHEFVPATYRFWRIQLSAGSAQAQIASVYLGNILVLERRIYVGHTPLPFGMKTTVSTGRSESGQFLGRVLRRKFYETTFNMQNIDPETCREDIDPFIQSIVHKAFFWAWRPEAYPEEVGFVWAMGDVNPANQRPNGMMQFDCGVQGIIE
jgi:hypothetical protein